MLENLQKYRIRLASNSPRRRELLSGLGIDYEVKLLPDIDETYPDTLKGEEIPLFIAREKAAAYLPSMESDELIITADTIVYVDDEVLGKPKDEADARRMLHLLSGRSHQVITGVCISTRHFQRAFAATTEVTFDTLSEEEIDFYVRTYPGMDWLHRCLRNERLLFQRDGPSCTTAIPGTEEMLSFGLSLSGHKKQATCSTTGK